MTCDSVKWLNEQSCRIGSDLDLAELFYSGDRNNTHNHLAAHGWQVAITSTADAHAANGSTPLDHGPTTAARSGHLSATLDC